MLEAGDIARLREGPIFAQPSDEAVRALAQHASLAQYQAGESILIEGDASEHAYALLNGVVGIVYTSAAGLSIVVKVLAPPVVFGELELLTNLPRQETVRVLEPAEVVIFPKEPFVQFLQTQPAACFQKLREMSTWLALSTHLERGLAFEAIDTRLAGFFVYLARQFSEPEPNGTRIRLRLTYPQLAASLAVTERSIERAVGAWLKEGWLSRERGRYLVHNMEQLEARANEEWLDLLDSLGL